MTATFTTGELLYCAARELRMRISAYPGWVTAGKMSAEKAEKEIAMMTAIVELLRSQHDAPAEPSPDQGSLL